MRHGGALANGNAVRCVASLRPVRRTVGARGPSRTSTCTTQQLRTSAPHATADMAPPPRAHTCETQPTRLSCMAPRRALTCVQRSSEGRRSPDHALLSRKPLLVVAAARGAGVRVVCGWCELLGVQLSGGRLDAAMWPRQGRWEQCVGRACVRFLHWAELASRPPLRAKRLRAGVVEPPR